MSAVKLENHEIIVPEWKLYSHQVLNIENQCHITGLLILLQLVRAKEANFKRTQIHADGHVQEGH
jgi:hypothetical protein